MPDPYQVRVYEKQQLLYRGEFQEPVELGRQSKETEQHYVPERDAGHWRVVIAPLSEQKISRRQILIEPLEEARFRLTNLSKSQPIQVLGVGEMRPRAPACEVSPPVVLTLAGKTVRIHAVEAEESPVYMLGEAPRAPGQPSAAGDLASLSLSVVGRMECGAVLRWLRAALEVLQSATTSSDFFQKAAQAVVELAGLETGQVLLLENGNWKTIAYHTAQPAQARTSPPRSQRVLNQLQQEKRTLWQIQESALGKGGSLADVQALVAAPILDPQDQVIGALYGDRTTPPRADAVPMTELEATLVELLASGVAAGLARLEQERAVLAAQIRFEQFFTPELARSLASQPDLLNGRDEKVSVLFCDIRSFSRFSERLGPARTVAWISDVMQTLSDCVLAHHGVLVDYIGDELMAMWGAPDKQTDHAALACRAALAMLGQLAPLNERWQPILQEPMRLGIGISSGVAHVGNTGSQRKFKYGPLGNTVNLASRVQGATKFLRVKLLITEATQAQLDPGFEVRRLGQVRVVNIAEPVQLYQLAPTGQANWSALQQGYEKALEEFERKEFAKAARILGNLLAESPGDGPSLVLLSRAVHFLVHEAAVVDTVWELPGK